METTVTTEPARIYGDRARIALMVPSPNTVAETEFWAMAPPGVTVHTSRMPFFGDRHEKPFEAMEDALPRVLEEVNSARPDVIAYGCTASSAKGDPAEVEARLTAEAGRPAVTAAGALIDALAVLDARRIVLLTPYPQSVNDKERGFFAGNGVTVLDDESVIVDEGQFAFRNMSAVPCDLLTERAVARADRDDVDAVVLSCCDMPTLDAISRIEDRTGLPVISSTQALFWKAARTAGLDDAIEGGGRLLEASRPVPLRRKTRAVV